MTASKRIAETIWKAVTVDREPPRSVAERFVRLTEKHNLGYLVPHVLRYLDLLARETRNERTLKLTVSHKVSDEVVNTIKRSVAMSLDEPVEVTIEPELLGGFVANYNNQIHDGSLRRELQVLEQALIQ